jgi:hypothetical protein
MKVGATAGILAVVSALLLLGTGCGGIYANQSVSPLTFLPMFTRSAPAPAPVPAPALTATNWTVAQAN